MTTAPSPGIVGILAPISRRIKLIATSDLSPYQLALTACIGAAVGILPVIWGTSLLCFWIARRLQLNQLVLQSINYLLYPLQLALLLPFCKLGILLIPWGPAVTPDQLVSIHKAGVTAAFSLLFWLSLKALVAWLITVVPLTLLVCQVLLVTTARRKSPA